MPLDTLTDTTSYSRIVAKKDGTRWFQEERWWQKTGNDLAVEVWEIGEGLKADQAGRSSRAKNMLQLYESEDTSSLFLSARAMETNRSKLDYNVTRAACDTVHAEIAGRQKPTGKLQTAGADWKTKRKAKKIEKYCNSILQASQGRYLNAWEFMEDLELDCTIWEAGVGKVYWDGQKICMDRCFAHELYVDPVEARYGDPQNLFHVFTMEKDRAIHEFALDPDLELSDKKRREIVRAIESSPEAEVAQDDPSAKNRISKSIQIIEAWRLQHKDGTPGKHVFAINNTLLHEEEWDRPEFPFVIMRWEWDRTGFFGRSLAHQGESIHRELRYNTEKMQERFLLCGAKRTFVEAGSIVNIELLQENDAESIIEFEKGSRPPVESAPKPISEAEFAYMQDLYDKYFETVGVSQMRSSARKEPGVTSGVAIRTMNDVQTARFSLKAKNYENAYVQLFKQIIYCTREAHAAGELKMDGDVDWGDVDLPEDTFEITIAPTSSLPNDPAGRMQMIQELYSNNIIGKETYKQLLGWPDLERQMDNMTAQANWLEKRIDKMVDDHDYEEPDAHLLDKPAALIQVTQAYFDALYDDAPDESVALLSRYLQSISRQIEDVQMQAMQQQAAAQAAAAQAQQMGGGLSEPQMGPPV